MLAFEDGAAKVQDGGVCADQECESRARQQQQVDHNGQAHASSRGPYVLDVDYYLPRRKRRQQTARSTRALNVRTACNPALLTPIACLAWLRALLRIDLCHRVVAEPEKMA